MAWNGSNDDKSGKSNDPWGGKRKPERPPNIEEALRLFLKKVIAAFVKQPATSSNNTSSNGLHSHSKEEIVAGTAIIGGIILIIWFLFGLFIVQPAESAVVLQFGRYVDTLGPGPHWVFRPFQSTYIVNEGQISNYSYEAQMLTKDENLVNVALAIQYRISDAKDYLFNGVNPQETLQQATASALRQVIGHTPLDLVLTSGREQVRREVRKQLEQILDRYNVGLLVTDVAIQPAKAPDEVKDAFDDAIKAQEDEQRFINQAQAYAMQVVPNAQGQAQRSLTDAQAYKQQVILQAKGETAGYLAVLPQYQISPAVTRDRMYIEMMEAILQNTNKIFVDLPSGNNMLYLPLDQLLKKNQEQMAASGNTYSTDDTSSMSNASVTKQINSDYNHSTRGGY